jgi:hypothetical protein
MCATLTDASPVFTRPTYSSMRFGGVPAAVTVVGAATSFGIKGSSSNRQSGGRFDPRDIGA